MASPRQLQLQTVLDQLRRLRQQRSALLRIFSRDNDLIGGCYREVYAECGKPTCRCHTEGGHYATRLSYWVDGKLKTKIVRFADRARVETASDHYKQHKSALRELRKLYTQEVKLLKQIIELKTTKYE